MLAQRIDAFGMSWAVLVLCVELAFFGSRAHALHATPAETITEREVADARVKLDNLERDVETSRSSGYMCNLPSERDRAAARRKLAELRVDRRVLQRRIEMQSRR